MKARKKFNVDLWLIVDADNEEEAKAIVDTCVDTLLEAGTGFVDGVGVINVEEQ